MSALYEALTDLANARHAAICASKTEAGSEPEPSASECLDLLRAALPYLAHADVPYSLYANVRSFVDRY